MGRDEKLIARFKSMPKDFTYNELVRLLNLFEFEEYKTGKTTGSGVKFRNKNFTDYKINFHKPHPDSNIKLYVLRQIKEILNECGFLLEVDKLTEEKDLLNATSSKPKKQK